MNSAEMITPSLDLSDYELNLPIPRRPRSSPSPSPTRIRPISSRRSSAIIQFPPEPVKLKFPRAPLPPEQFIFFPQPVHIVKSNMRNQWLYGWKQASTIVVAGVIQAQNRENAEKQMTILPTVFKIQILGKLFNSRPDEAKHLKLDPGSSSKPLLEIYIATERSQKSIESNSNATIILYQPPSRTQLQFFSLTELQLDLNSFSLPSVASDTTSITAYTEEEILSEKLRKSAKLDFTHTSNASVGEAVDLEQVIEHVCKYQ